MTEELSKKMVGAFSGLLSLRYGRQLIVFIISLMPILELRGGLIAASLLNLPPLESYLIAIAGNLIPVPFILLFVESILRWMADCRIGFFRKIARWIYKKAEKHKASIETYGFWGLVLFVGIPLPGTGAWTGCLVASLLHMDKKKALLATILGVLMASVIMMFISFGVIGKIVH